MPAKRSRWAEFLPWYRPDDEAQRDKQSAKIAAKSHAAQARADRVIKAYRAADATAEHADDARGQAVEDLLEELERK